MKEGDKLGNPRNYSHLYTKFVWPSKTCRHSPLVLHFRIVLKTPKHFLQLLIFVFELTENFI